MTAKPTFANQGISPADIQLILALVAGTVATEDLGFTFNHTSMQWQVRDMASPGTPVVGTRDNSTGEWS